MTGTVGRFGRGAILLVIVLAVTLATLGGWAIGVRALYTLGVPNYPCWPLTALGYLAMLTALLFGMAGRRNAALPLLCLPLMIGIVSLVEYVLGFDLGIEHLLFARSVNAWPLPHPGRPGLIAAIGLLGVAITALLAIRGDYRHETSLLALGAIMMSLGWLSIALLLFGFSADVIQQPQRLVTSIPASIMMIGLASACFAYRAAGDPRSLFAPKSASGRAINLALPVLLILPAATMPLERALVRSHIATSFTAYLMAVAIEIGAAVTLVAIGIGRIAHDDEALTESEARLEHALEAHRIGLFDWETTTNKLRWSPGAEERLGVEVGSMNDFEDWAALVPKDEAAQVMATIADTAQRRAERYSFAYHIRRADGEMRNIEGSGRCFYDKDGELLRVTGVNIDVTERVRHEAEIERREAQWLSILTTVPDAMIVIDRKGEIVTFSAAAERLFGHAAGEVVGKSALVLLPETDAQVISAQLALGMDPAREQAPSDRILTALRRDGSQIPVEYSVGQTIVDGAPIYTAFVRDISDRQEVERRFSALQQEYAHSARLNAVGELASGLAHELNQPLAAGANFLGVAELMLEQQEGLEPVVEMIAEANGQLQRAGEIIRRLRDFIAKTDIDMRVEPLEETLREAVALGLSGARKQQIEVGYDIAAGAEYIFADRIQIQQVVVNLVRNAAEALRIMPPERRVILIAARPIDAEKLEVTIADRGPGLPQEMLTALFEPFRSTKQGAGLGIGLSICRRIVEAHGGSFSARNVDGGARFSFTLPRVSEDQEVGDACVTSMS